jgi:hypothetical protein
MDELFENMDDFFRSFLNIDRLSRPPSPASPVPSPLPPPRQLQDHEVEACINISDQIGSGRFPDNQAANATTNIDIMLNYTPPLQTGEYGPFNEDTPYSTAEGSPMASAGEITDWNRCICAVGCSFLSTSSTSSRISCPGRRRSG